MAIQDSIGGQRDIGTTRGAAAAWAAALDVLLRRGNAFARAYAGCTSADFQAMGYTATAGDLLVQFVAALPVLPATAAIVTALTYADKLRDIGAG